MDKRIPRVEAQWLWRHWPCPFFTKWNLGPGHRSLQQVSILWPGMGIEYRILENENAGVGGEGGGEWRKILCVCFVQSDLQWGRLRQSEKWVLFVLNTELEWPSRSTALLLSIKNVIIHCFAFIYSGDDQIKLAGGPGKFVTDVAVKHDGLNTWSGPATFKANCDMQVDKWPFDEQNCSLAFGSFTYGENLLRIKTFKAKNQLTSKK